jgi:hypothetical protein
MVGGPASQDHDPHREVRQKILAHYTSNPVLGPGDPVPGCACEKCTGVVATITSPGRWEKWSALVERARGRRITTVCHLLGIEIRPAGKEYMASCPFHEDRNPSFTVNPEKGVFFCHSCGEGGDAIALYQEVRKLSFADAVRELSAA